MMYCKVEKMIETMDKVVEKTLHLVTPDSLKYMDSDNLEMDSINRQINMLEFRLVVNADKGEEV